MSAESIQAINTSEYPTAAPRPLNSRLNTQLFENTFGLCLPHWQHGVLDMLNSLHPSALK
jgi:dTDP-4-dehydrorhamnose reductase